MSRIQQIYFVLKTSFKFFFRKLRIVILTFGSRGREIFNIDISYA